MKLNWQTLSAVAAVVLTIVGMDVAAQWRLADRVSDLETLAASHWERTQELLQPVLVEYYVQKRLKELRGETAVHFDDVPEPPMAPAPAMVPHLAPPEEELREEAREWAEKQFKR